MPHENLAPSDPVVCVGSKSAFPAVWSSPRPLTLAVPARDFRVPVCGHERISPLPPASARYAIKTLGRCFPVQLSSCATCAPFFHPSCPARIAAPSGRAPSRACHCLSHPSCFLALRPGGVSINAREVFLRSVVGCRAVGPPIQSLMVLVTPDRPPPQVCCGNCHRVRPGPALPSMAWHADPVRRGGEGPSAPE